jgi:hypothetical protein
VAATCNVCCSANIVRCSAGTVLHCTALHCLPCPDRWGPHLLCWRRCLWEEKCSVHILFLGLSGVAMFVNMSHNKSMQILGFKCRSVVLPSLMDLATDVSFNKLET